MYRGKAAYSARVLLVTRAEGYTAQQLDDAVGHVITGFRLGVFDASVENAPGERTTHTLAVGLWVFALIAGLVSVLVANQAVARHVDGADSDHPALTALGFTRKQRMLGVMATVIPAAAAAAIVAVLASYAASSLMPVGIARRVEPDPGLRFDPVAAGLGVLFVIATILLTAMIAAAAATRTRSPSHATSTRVPRAAAVTPTSLGPVASTGIRLAFDRRSPALPVRSTILAVAAALTVLVGALTFGASLNHLEASPERWGYGWDLSLDTTPDQADAFVAELDADPALDGVSLLRSNFTYMRAGGRTDGMLAYGIETRSGHVGYALVSGSQPVGVDEVVIGPATARSLGLRIGSTLDVQTCPCTGDQAEPAMEQVRVVGISLFPEDDNGNFNNALGFSERGYAAHVDVTPDIHAIVSTAPARDPRRVAQDLSKRFPDSVSAYSYPSRPGEVGTLASLRSFPTALVAVAAVLGSAVLLNMLIATRTRRRRELATLWSLGLTSRELRGCVAWQSVGIVAIALVLGTIAGLAAGGAVWIAATDGIGVATDVSRPVTAIVVWSCVALAVAVVLGSLSGSRLRNIHLAGSLRQE